MAIILQRVTAILTGAVLSVLPLFGVAAPKATMNIPFAKDSVFQMMDIAFPEGYERITEPVSAILVIHGGGWISGTRLYHVPEIEGYAKQGFVAAAMDYRLSLGWPGYLEMLQDVEHALQEMARQAQQRGLTIKNVVLLGNSAGRHLALLYSFKYHRTSPIDIAFCVGQVPPSYFLDPYMIENAGEYFATYLGLWTLLNVPVTPKNIATKYADIASDASPYVFLDAGCPPAIVCFGMQDKLVPYSNGLLMREKMTQLRAQGYDFGYVAFENSGHNLENDPESWQEYGKLFEAFLKKYT